MAKRTRIFKVEYYYIQLFNGKRDGEPIEGKMSIVAKNAAQAAGLVGLIVTKERTSFKSDETGKMIECTNASYDPTNITLQAEA